jgi:hypothetical protein
MPELLELRLMRSRAHVDPLLAPEERTRKLAAMADEIHVLDSVLADLKEDK